jgi:hypothetical protein
MAIRLRKVVAVVRKVILSVLIGITLSTLVWTTLYLSRGQFIEAVKGNVEDAYGMLWGVFSLGIFAGLVGGVAWSPLEVRSTAGRSYGMIEETSGG